MQLPLQITFRHMASSDAVAARIRQNCGFILSAEGPRASTVVALGKHHLPPTEAVRA